MEKINVAELLKDCPKGMELDCALFENLEFDRIDKDNGAYSIICCVKTEWECYNTHTFTEYGCYSTEKYSKCVIFPKGKTTWEGFQRPFEDGDVVVAEDAESFQLFLLKHLTHSEDDNNYDGYCYFGWNFQCNDLFEKGNWGFNRLATEEEKQKLFQAIKDNGYKWNEETKTLEKLPKFKVGDRIRKMGETSTYTITDVNNAHYFCGKYVICDTCDNDWELVPNKFDITTLKVFDKVLVRDSNEGMWSASIFSHTWKNKYICIGIWYNQCIPYEGNEHLLGTANDCDEYYKTWE